MVRLSSLLKKPLVLKMRVKTRKCLIMMFFVKNGRKIATQCCLAKIQSFLQTMKLSSTVCKIQYQNFNLSNGSPKKVSTRHFFWGNKSHEHQKLLHFFKRLYDHYMPPPGSHMVGRLNWHLKRWVPQCDCELSFRTPSKKTFDVMRL